MLRTKIALTPVLVNNFCTDGTRKTSHPLERGLTSIAFKHKHICIVDSTTRNSTLN